MNKAKLEKMYHAKSKAWLMLWRNFSEFRAYMPQSSMLFFDESSMAASIATFEALSENQKAGVNAKHQQRTGDLYKEFGLEPQPWQAWTDSLNAIFTAFDIDHPDLSLNPFVLPNPPTCPDTALNQVHRLSFGADIDNWPELNFVYYLAIAKRVCEVKNLQLSSRGQA